jgi:hypothetical protein
LRFPPLAIEVRWTLAQMMDYIGTWTATRRMLEKDPEFLAARAMRSRRPGAPRSRAPSRLPLTVLCGRHGGR